MLLGGLCRDWCHYQTGELVTSCSVITLAPHEKLQHIHSQSTPLILPKDNQTIDTWLDNKVTQIDKLEPLLQPYIPQNLIAQQIDKPMSYNNIGHANLIYADMNK